MHVTAVLLAAGSATRMKADKLALEYKGQTVFARALAPLTAARGVDEVIVVVNPDSRLPVDPARCTVVVNADFALGMSTSLRAGVMAASLETEAFLVALADMPELTARLIQTLIDAFGRSGKRILVPRYNHRNGHPVLFYAGYKDELLQLQGDVGARSLLSRHADSVEHFETDDRAVLFDLDTPESLLMRRIESSDADGHRPGSA